MKPILMIYATREGHTRHIAEHMAATLHEQHLESDLVDAAHIPAGFSLKDYSAAIVSASVHVGKHEREITKFVKRHLAELKQIPTAFLSVSLSEAGAEDKLAPSERRAQAQADVERIISTFLADTGWNPSNVKAVAGALMYLNYNFVVRFVMKRIAQQVGEPTDTSRNYEFTDWAGLDQIVREFAHDLAISCARAGAA
ncbi:MAG TPA: flavodoxin domain-containing protein [Bryobacteraceae bacterium]